LFCSQQVLKDPSLITNINSNGCRQAIIEIAQYGVKILSSCLVGLTIIFSITVILVQFLMILVRKEQALYNAKNAKINKNGQYTELDNDDEALDFIN
jgi:hypothetical protein